MLREDYGTSCGRTRDWPSVPKNLSKFYGVGIDSSVVCSQCGRPQGGLRLEPSTMEFMHSDPADCALARFSQR